jgi:hypothetical protein
MHDVNNTFAVFLLNRFEKGMCAGGCAASAEYSSPLRLMCRRLELPMFRPVSDCVTGWIRIAGALARGVFAAALICLPILLFSACSKAPERVPSPSAPPPSAAATQSLSQAVAVPSTNPVIASPTNKAAPSATPDFIPEKLTPNSDPKGVIGGQLELQREINNVSSELAHLTQKIRQATFVLYQSDSEAKALSAKARELQQKVTARVSNAPGRAEVMETCRELESELKPLRTELQTLMDEHFKTGCRDHSTGSDIHDKIRAKQQEVAAAEKPLMEARKKLAEISDTQLKDDTELASLRATLKATYAQISDRVKGNAEIASLREKEQELIAHKRELLSKLPGGASPAGGVSTRPARPLPAHN